MIELFRLEAESQTQSLTASLLALERAPSAANHLEACMRAAHSLKGAARLVGIAPAVTVTHVMEDCFVAAQRGEIVLNRDQIDLLLEGVELLVRTADPTASTAGTELHTQADEFAAAFTVRLAGKPSTPVDVSASPPTRLNPVAATPNPPPIPLPEDRRVLRVTAENFNRLLGLAGESLVESSRLKTPLAALVRLRRLHQEATTILGGLRHLTEAPQVGARSSSAWDALRTRLADCQAELATQIEALETVDSRAIDLAKRLYEEALACRMRPFADGVAGFPKMVRSVAHALGKATRLELTGEATQVDRDVLETLESPLVHLLRNAVDHGIEMPNVRRAAGKVVEGVIRLDASHHAGMLQIIVSDDGAGVDLDRLRTLVIERNMVQPAVAETLSDAELLEFLFLPGFTMKPTVTEFSGRGVGLDTVRSMIKQLRGTIRLHSMPGEGTHFELRLPLTLSVVRTLLADVGGEAYAFPLAQIIRAVQLRGQEIELIEGKPHFRFEGQHVGLMDAAQLLGGPAPPHQDMISVIVVAENSAHHGLIVDRFLGERESVVHPLDSRLGKIADIVAASTMEDGAPVLIVDVSDVIRSIEKLVGGGTYRAMLQHGVETAQRSRKRILVVDDSLTVRELERKLLDQAGYAVETAVDGMEGWNVVRAGRFDLVITDVDMPRMDGIELVQLLKQDPHFADLPVMIVSYKEEETDRQRGLEAGADYYLPKGGFQDETLLHAVRDLIGEPIA